jgi:diguanylate cyclase (GGDEF)-like protein
MPETGSDATEADWDAARTRSRRTSYVLGAVGLVLIAVVTVPAVYLTTLLVSGPARYPVTSAWLALFMAPIIFAMLRRSIAEQARSDEVVSTLTTRLSDAVTAADDEAARRAMQAKRQEFESRLANALEMADGEPEVIAVIERSFATALPGLAVELLLADNSHAHLLRMATAAPGGAPPGCGVDSPDHCPAARRAQTQRFVDSDELDACPKLRGRPEGAISAVCVPVSIMGRSVGVIHSTGAQHALASKTAVNDLETLAKLAGARIGLLRVMNETQLQAATDSLTGLMNRRAFEHALSQLRRTTSVVAIAMADLDHFKDLNDTYGHETGDRALRLYGHVLATSLRGDDLLCRHGGEEFVAALPNCAISDALRILDDMRARLATAIAQAGLPSFTVSIGVIDAGAQEDVPTLLARADAALFRAKHAGRDQVLALDSTGEIVETAATLAEQQPRRADNAEEPAAVSGAR